MVNYALRLIALQQLVYFAAGQLTPHPFLLSCSVLGHVIERETFAASHHSGRPLRRREKPSPPGLQSVSA